MGLVDGSPRKAIGLPAHTPHCSECRCLWQRQYAAASQSQLRFHQRAQQRLGRGELYGSPLHPASAACSASRMAAMAGPPLQVGPSYCLLPLPPSRVLLTRARVAPVLQDAHIASESRK